MSYLGRWKIDDALTFAGNTHDPTTSGASDADSAPTYRVYEDETGTAILTGMMALLDSSNTTGFYSEQITLSAANGFEEGKQYTIYISATVGGIQGTTHHTFQVEPEIAKEATLGTPTDTDLATDIANLNDLSAAEVNAEMVDVLTVDSLSEPTGVPAAAATFSQKIGFLYAAARNKITVTSSKKQYFDNGNNALWEKNLSDDGTTYSETQANSP